MSELFEDHAHSTDQLIGVSTFMSKKSYTVTELFGEAYEITIFHDGVEYRLRITSNNKLILTK